jgi:hypothetical protein
MVALPLVGSSLRGPPWQNGRLHSTDPARAPARWLGRSTGDTSAHGTLRNRHSGIGNLSLSEPAVRHTDTGPPQSVTPPPAAEQGYPRNPTPQRGTPLGLPIILHIDVLDFPGDNARRLTRRTLMRMKMPSSSTRRRTAPIQPLPPQPTAAIALRALLPEPERDTVVQGPNRQETPPPPAGQIVELERPASRGATNPRFISMEALVQQHQRQAQEAEARAQQLEAALEEAALSQNGRYSTQPAPTMLATVASLPVAAIWGVGNALRATPGAILNAPWTLASTAHGAVSSVANTYGRTMVWWSRPTAPETPINFRTVEERPSFQHTKRFPRSAGTAQWRRQGRERGQPVTSSLSGPSFIRRRNIQQLSEGDRQ